MIDVAGAIHRAAAHLDSAAALASAANELPAPRLFFRERAITKIHATYAQATAQGHRALAELRGVTGPAADMVRGVDELLTKIDPSVPRDRHHGLAHRRQHSETRDVAGKLAIRADQLRFVRDHLDADPATVRSTLERELVDITTKPYEHVTRDDVRRLALIDGLPEPLRPSMPPRLRDDYGPEEFVLRRMLPGTDEFARGEFEMHRLARDRAAIAADPTVTREALDAEVRAIVATPNDEVTTEQMHRLSTIAGLGDALRPAIVDTPTPWPHHRIADLAALNWGPETDGQGRAKFNAMRMYIEHEALIADPSVTRDSVTRELVELLSIPQETLTDAQLYRTSLLARLPEHLRPPMPPRLDHYDFQDLGLLRYHPGRNLAASKVFDLTRVHIAAVVDPELTVRQLAAQVTAGQRIDFRVLAALDGQEALLARHGLTPDVLNREAVRSLAGAGAAPTGETSRDALRHHLQIVRAKEALRHHLQIVRETIEQVPAGDAKVASIRTTALELADRNLDRMSGTRTDTFARHPDYAEIGRIVSIAELLEAITRRPAPAPAATTGEVLTW